MAEPEKLVLGDKSVYPSEDILFSIIGDKKIVWQKIMGYVKDNYKNVTEEWRYYNDGKSWLMKVTRKSKTVFWLSVIKGAFRITFYLPHRAEDAIQASSISNELKDMFCKGEHPGKLRGLTVVFRDKADIENAMALIAVKLSIR